MSFTYGFYESKNGDRTYKARQFARLFDGLITDGVFMTVGDCFAVKPRSGMSVIVGTGKAWFNHTWSENDTEMIVTTAESDMLLPRIDALVLEVDETESVRANSIKFITGTAATEPVKPTLTNTEFVHQHPLKYITIPADSTEITAENIENVVGTSECPFVTGILEGMDIDELVIQWEAQFKAWSDIQKAQFQAWFDSLKVKLDGDVAGNLQNQINERMMKFSSENPITSADNDTVDKWVSLGAGIYHFSQTDCLINQPSQYGFVFNMVHNNDVHQVWYNLPSGYMYHRSGNTNGWGNVWRQLIDSNGGYMENTLFARFDSRTIVQDTGEVMNIGVQDSVGTAVSSSFIVMRRK